MRTEPVGARRRRPTPRTVILAATAVSLVLSFVLSAVWFALVPGTSRFEPAVQSLGLLAGIAGIIAERRAGMVEQRDRALAAVRAELEDNRRILDAFLAARDAGPRRQVYRRLYSSAVDATLSSVVLLRQDEPLARTLHEWRDAVGTFNQRLSIAEFLAFMAGSEDLLRELHQALHAADGPVRDLRDQLDEVAAALPATTVPSGPTP